MDYSCTREHFNKIVEKYKDYIKLYRSFNNGDDKGITPFNEFYWRLTYFTRYQDVDRIGVDRNA